MPKQEAKKEAAKVPQKVAQLNVRVPAEFKRNLEFYAHALGLEAGVLVHEACQQYMQAHMGQVQMYVDGVLRPSKGEK